MSKSEKGTAVQLVSKESVLAYGDDYVEYIIDHLKRTISGKVIDRAELSDVIVSLKPIITEQLLTNQVEYRLNMTVADLVRCKDCRFYRFYDGTFGKGWMCFENNTARHGDDFCSRGERKDDES